MPGTVVRSISPAQVQLIEDLMDERDLFKDPQFFDAVQAMDEDEYKRYLTTIKNGLGSLTMDRASEIITKLKALPFPEGTAVADGRGDWVHSPAHGSAELVAAREAVPAGHYAIDGQQGVEFYRVDKPTQGRWDGYTFVKQQSGDNHLRIPREQADAALIAIRRAGPEQASKRYGRELGRCGVCRHTLTDPDSIERGIGPVCIKKRGWSL